MDFTSFSEQYGNQENGQQNNNSQAVEWFKLGKNESAKLVVPQPPDGMSLIGVAKSIYIKGVSGGRTIRTTAETYRLLLEKGVVPKKKAANGGEYDEKSHVRAMVNVLNLTAGKRMVWEMSKSMATRLAALDEDPDTPSLHDAVVRITKRSTGPMPKDVEYDIQILGEAKLTSEQEKACENLHDVEKMAQPHSEEFIRKFLGISANDSGENDNIPF